MTLLQLAWQTVRARKVSFAGSFTAMVCAQALITACAVLLESGNRTPAGQGGTDMVSFAVPFGFICLFVAAFAVSGTFSLSVQQRTREIALLRAVAATPGQVRRLIALEALVVTVAAIVPGCGLGVLIAAGIRAVLVERSMVPDAFRLSIGPLSLLSAVAICWVTAEVAVWGSGRRASRVRAVQALGEAAVPNRRAGMVRTATGLAVLAGGIWGLSAIAGSEQSDAANTATGMVMVLMVAVALLAPWIGRLAGFAFGILCHVLFPGVGFLVRANLNLGHRRLAAAVVPLALTVAFAAVALLVPQMKWREYQRQDNERMVADHLVQASGKGLPVTAAPTVSRLPGTVTAIGTTATYVEILTGDGPDAAGSTATAQAVTEGRLGQVLDLGPAEGSLDGLGLHDIALSERVAHRSHARVGDELRVRMPDYRTERVRVAAVYTRSRGFGDAVLSQQLYAAHPVGTPQGPDTVYVRTATDNSLAALHRDHPTWRVLDRTEYRAEAKRRQDASMTATYLLLVVVTVFTSISVVNTSVMTTMERSREFALLRLVGATREQVVRMMRLESAVTVLAALLVGAAVAWGVLTTVSRALTGSADPHVSAATTALILTGSGALALATGILATRIALRQGPSAALRGAE
ncbi:ABC transporter permease [Streptomyces olivoreticuli]|uniref:FtsX-like permease family protein n=1 Tax=Streptomyces olivoreticuli TaxID=68246 RepID=UPI002659A703|nr:ABC transporter permease [Streptomyces olivoreticuli]WKK26614.1 ABC transporter permease [Streptomyces olivoreticuli]